MLESALALVCAREFARTYSPRNYDDPWQEIVDYVSALEHRERYPEQPLIQAADELGVTRSQLEGWTGTRSQVKTPRTVESVFDALEREWIGIEPWHPNAEPLAVLVAHTLAAGSITAQRYRLELTGDGDALEGVLSAFEALNVDVEREPTEDSTLVWPATDGPMLARVLVCMGSVPGDKANDPDLELPEFVRTGPRHLREAFVVQYLRARAIQNAPAATHRINSERNEQYREQLADAIASVAGEGDVNVGERTIEISADASRAFGLVE